MENNFYIKKSNHYKLYIPLKEKIIFESEMIKNNIDFYSSLDEQPFIEGGIRYFLLDRDRFKIDKLIKENKILSGVESIQTVDYDDTKKLYSLYFKLFFIIFIIIGVIYFAVSLYDKISSK